MTATAQKQGDTKETLGFQAEVKQLLKLMIHSLYSNKEIFLRELISNASDACDKLRFAAISNQTLTEQAQDIKINVSFNKEARTITIADNGIGMSRDEVVANIGTIARSGTKEFFEQLTGDKQKDASLIGQFGVGFYSSFIVADKVTLKTRRAGAKNEEGVLWESAGEGDYTIEAIEKESRGTEITLHLKSGEDEFLDENRLEDIIKKFSDHISLPVFLTKIDEKNAQTEEKVNAASALWARPKSQIKPEEYTEFYKTVSHDFSEPLTHIHVRLEGNLEYTLLLYIPKQAPFDLWTQEHRLGVKLYVKRVFIMDDAEKLLPKYLRFVRGVVDSSDLALNVSREILQDNQIIATIRNTAVKKILDLLEDIAANDKEKFKQFWKEFGRVFKEGMVEDFINRERIAKICRFASTQDDKEEPEVSLDDYMFRMKKGQSDIFYLIADSFLSAKNSPLLEMFRKKGIEVLLLSDRVDHWFVTHLGEYKGKKLISVSKEDVDLGKISGGDEEIKPEEKAANDEAEKTGKEIAERLKKALADSVLEVRVSKRLTSSPSCLVAAKNDLDPNLKQLFKSMGQTVPMDKPILEINPRHVLIQKLSSETNETRLASWAKVLLDQAILSEGGLLANPSEFVRELNLLLAQVS